jgi:hypothetical protein
VVDLAGHWRVPPFDERQRLSDSVSVAVIGGHWGLVRRATGELIRPDPWEEVGTVREGLAGVRGTDGRLGLIDLEGRAVIAPRFRLLGAFDRGLCKAATRDTLGYIDPSGAWVWASRIH